MTATCCRRLDEAVAEHGFRITSNEVDSEAADAAHLRGVLRIAASAAPTYSSYVVVAMRRRWRSSRSRARSASPASSTASATM
jgi:hypothetical protein